MGVLISRAPRHRRKTGVAANALYPDPMPGVQRSQVRKAQLAKHYRKGMRQASCLRRKPNHERNHE